MDHPYIIKLYYAIEDKTHITLVMQFVGKQSLNHFLRKFPDK